MHRRRGAGSRPCPAAQVLHITQSALRPLRQHQLRSFAPSNSPDVAHRSAQSSSVIITWRWHTHNGNRRSCREPPEKSHRSCGTCDLLHRDAQVGGGGFFPNRGERRDSVFFFLPSFKCGCCLLLQEEAERRSGKAECPSEGSGLRLCAALAPDTETAVSSRAGLRRRSSCIRAQDKSVIFKRMCCHGCQALRASAAVLGIELGGEGVGWWGGIAPIPRCKICSEFVTFLPKRAPFVVEGRWGMK